MITPKDKQESGYLLDPSSIPCGALSGIALKVARLEKDPHRPRYHFQPKAGEWMNDVHSFFWKGTYHVFFQYSTSNWQLRQWGHARSRDLVHWEELPIALAAGPQRYDKDRCNSGCLLTYREKVHIFYTGICNKPDFPNQASICHATALDGDLIQWQKDPANPLRAAIRCDAPDIWKDGDAWYMLLGTDSPYSQVSSIPLSHYSRVCEMSIYSSSDLRNWTRVGTFYRDDDFNYLEFPHFFALDGKHVLFTTNGAEGWQQADIGHYADGVFHSERRSEYDSTLNCAGKTLLDDRGRRIVMSWILEDRAGNVSTSLEQRYIGWAGIMSLPRLLHVAPDCALLMEPVPELEALRNQYMHVPRMRIKTEKNAAKIGNYKMVLLEGIEGDCLEIVVKFRPQNAKRFGLLVRCAPDLSEQSRILVDLERKKLIFNNRRSSLDCSYPRLNKRSREVDLNVSPDEDVVLRVFLDRSVVEIFANQNRASITGRMYPQREDSLRIGICCSSGSVLCEGIDVWKIQEIN